MQRTAVQKGLALVTPALVFGFLVATQWTTLARPDVAIRYIDPLSDTVTRLQGDQAALRQQLASIRGQLDQLQRASSTQSGAVGALQSQIDDLRVQAGLAEAHGDGVVITLDAARPTGSAAKEPFCFAPDLTDLVNAAWRGGASAIAINNERLVSSSSVYCVGGTIVVNGSITSAPFSISAVGPPASILAVLDDEAQLRDLKKRRDDRSVTLQFTRATTLSVPAYRGALAVRQATPR
ncbi:MAG: DUF881 domain-containing protein [Chloroflexi bacterium]|nr:DUF881 domain-containing protein [Chloroflexota bacterium]